MMEMKVTVIFLHLACLWMSLHFHSVSAGRKKWLSNNNSLFHGDILIRDKSLFQQKGATPNKSSRWPDGIVYYTLDSSYSDEDVAIIKSAMEEFESQTCIKWVERTDEDHYVEIENDIGCWSELGFLHHGQTISLESPFCMKKGVIMHEMMHTLGFMHEMARSDRDDYVEINWENIIPGMEANFEKLTPLEIDDLGLKYDYKSVMHYKAYAFAKNMSKATVTPKDYSILLSDLGYGQTEGTFTDTDLQKIKIFYECES